MFRQLSSTLLAALLAAGFLAIPATAATTETCGSPWRLDAATFPTPVKVNNSYFPLTPGTNWVMSGSVSGGTHKIVTTVTDLTKVIDGVQTIVVLDEDFDGNVPQEAELAFFAQSNLGTVWGLGEYPEEYDNGVFAGAPSTWISGLSGARAGVAMLANPTPDRAPYLQGKALSIGFEDCARVFATGQQLCEPAGCYRDVLVTDEWAPLDPAGGHQRKSYAPGIGQVRVGAIGGDSPEVLDLTRYAHLNPHDLTAARDRALALDKHGYQVSPKVYGKTPPAARTLRAGC